MIKKLLTLLLIFGLSASPVFSAERITLQNGSGIEVGTAANPLYITGLGIGSNLTSATQGSILYAGASGVLAQDNSHFFFDASNKTLIINTTSDQTTPGATSKFAIIAKHLTAEYSGFYFEDIQSADGDTTWGAYNLYNSGAGTCTTDKRYFWGVQNEAYLSSVGDATHYAEGIGTFNYMVPSGAYARAYGIDNVIVSTQDNGQNFIAHAVANVAGTGNTTVAYHMDYTSSSGHANTYLGNYFVIKPQSATDTVAAFYIDTTGAATLTNPANPMACFYINWSLPGTDTSKMKYSFDVLNTSNDSAKAYFGDSVIVGKALATDATVGFFYIPTCAGTPTGTPVSYTGTVPMVYDSTNHKLYIYDSGWKSATFA